MSTQSPTLARVLKGRTCTGCGLCAGIAPDAIRMVSEAPGYARPEQSAPISAEAEAQIATACPGAKVAPWDTNPAPRDTYWGPALDVLTGWSLDETVRYEGSSGGVLTALAIHALKTGQVDAVIHNVADPERPTRNRIAISETAEGVLAGAGSRYAASSPLSMIGALLDSGKRHAFIGKPCDVSALRQLALVDPRVDAVIPLKLAFFCAGIPSHDGADRIIRKMDLEPEDVIAFRYRGQGWPGLTRAETRDGKVGTMRYEDSWGRHLSPTVQFRCKICPDAVGGVADIACADAWYGGETGYPTFEEQQGRSLVMVRTPAGQALLEAAMASGEVATEPVPVRDIDLMQPSQLRRKQWIGPRTLACRLTGSPVPEMSGLDVAAAAREGSRKDWFRNLAGTMRRVLQRRF